MRDLREMVEHWNGLVTKIREDAARTDFDERYRLETKAKQLAACALELEAVLAEGAAPEPTDGELFAFLAMITPQGRGIDTTVYNPASVRDALSVLWDQMASRAPEVAPPQDQIIEIDSEGRIHFPETCGECGAPVKYFTTGSSMPKPRYQASPEAAPPPQLPARRNLSPTGEPTVDETRAFIAAGRSLSLRDAVAELLASADETMRGSGARARPPDAHGGAYLSRYRFERLREAYRVSGLGEPTP